MEDLHLILLGGPFVVIRWKRYVNFYHYGLIYAYYHSNIYQKGLYPGKGSP